MSTSLPLLHDTLTLCIDVDSTALNHESLTGYVQTVCNAADAATRSAVIAEINRITELGMNNHIGFAESLNMRAEVIKSLGATRRHVDEYVTMLRTELAVAPRNILTPSFADNADWIRRNSANIYFLSGGMDAIVSPLLELAFGIPAERVRANGMLFDGPGPEARFIGFDTTRLLYRDDGKAAQIKALRNEGAVGPVVMLGDGGNDYNAKQAGGADIFVAFTEVKNRDWSEVSDVDFIAPTLPHAVDYLSYFRNSQKTL